jgi:hypothetical protein
VLSCEIKSLIRKSGNRLSEKIMLKQTDKRMMRFRLNRIMIQPQAYTSSQLEVSVTRMERRAVFSY